MKTLTESPRYATADGGADWEGAEEQIKNAQGKSSKSNTVSVKSHKADANKRKAGEAVAEALKEAVTTRPKKQKKSKGNK